MMSCWYASVSYKNTDIDKLSPFMMHVNLTLHRLVDKQTALVGMDTRSIV